MEFSLDIKCKHVHRYKRDHSNMIDLQGPECHLKLNSAYLKVKNLFLLEVFHSKVMPSDAKWAGQEPDWPVSTQARLPGPPGRGWHLKTIPPLARGQFCHLPKVSAPQFLAASAPRQHFGCAPAARQARKPELGSSLWGCAVIPGR